MSEHHDSAPQSGSHGQGHAAGRHGGGGHDGEHEGAPEWLISFADNVTLMMGFFVILLACNMGPKGTVESDHNSAGPDGGAPVNFLDAALSIREAFNNPVLPNSMDPRDQVLVKRLHERTGKAFVEDDGPAGDAHEVQSLKLEDHDGLCGLIHFQNQSSELTASARKTIAETARHLRGIRLRVEVRGHVSAAEAYHLPDRGMKLAFERALAVAQELKANDIEWRVLRVVACADNERLNEATYEAAGHEDNVRVEIVQTDEFLDRQARPGVPDDENR